MCIRDSCPFENHSNGSGANAAITFGTTLGFICHDSDCSSKKISDVVRWAWDKTRRSCPCPIWLDEGDLWEIEQHKMCIRDRNQGRVPIPGKVFADETEWPDPLHQACDQGPIERPGAVYEKKK